MHGHHGQVYLAIESWKFGYEPGIFGYTSGQIIVSGHGYYALHFYARVYDCTSSI